MSQQQSQRSQMDLHPIKYGDVFPVPQDAAAMQAVENQALGNIRKGGPASVMQTAANVNVVGQYVEPKVPKSTPGTAANPGAMITIGEALEASAMSSTGGKPVDQADAAAIQAAEMRATGMREVLPGGLGAQAQSAANRNTRATRDEKKTTIADVLAGAPMELPSDKPVTGEDAKGVIEAEIRNKPNLRPTPGGVARSMAVAARMNQIE